MILCFVFHTNSVIICVIRPFVPPIGRFSVRRKAAKRNQASASSPSGRKRKATARCVRAVHSWLPRLLMICFCVSHRFASPCTGDSESADSYVAPRFHALVGACVSVDRHHISRPAMACTSSRILCIRAAETLGRNFAQAKAGARANR